MSQMMYDPHLYQLLHTGIPGDRAFYTAECPPGTDVLELGCGYGRITLELVLGGANVTGLELHDGMMSCLRKAAAALPDDRLGRLSLVRGDMRRFELHASFDKILIPYNGLLCLLSDDDVVRCLSCAAGHLTSTGELLFDIYDVPWDENGDEPAEDDEFEHITTLHDERQTIHVFECSVPHPDPRRFDTIYRHIICDDAGNERQAEHTIAQRCIYQKDLSGLLERAGLELVSITADFKEKPIDDDTGQLVVRARRVSP